MSLTALIAIGTVSVEVPACLVIIDASSAGRDGRVDEGRADLAARDFPVVVEGVGGGVVGVFPGTRGDPVPPGVAVGNPEPGHRAAHLDRVARAPRRTAASF